MEDRESRVASASARSEDSCGALERGPDEDDERDAPEPLPPALPVEVIIKRPPHPTPSQQFKRNEKVASSAAPGLGLLLDFAQGRRQPALGKTQHNSAAGSKRTAQQSAGSRASAAATATTGRATKTGNSEEREQGGDGENNKKNRGELLSRPPPPSSSKRPAGDASQPNQPPPSRINPAEAHAQLTSPSTPTTLTHRRHTSLSSPSPTTTVPRTRPAATASSAPSPPSAASAALRTAIHEPSPVRAPANKHTRTPNLNNSAAAGRAATADLAHAARAAQAPVVTSDHSPVITAQGPPPTSPNPPTQNNPHQLLSAVSPPPARLVSALSPSSPASAASVSPTPSASASAAAAAAAAPAAAAEGPARQRFPARFSSNGIATTDGPPPSLAYRRRTLSMDHRGTPYRFGTGDRSSASSSTISARQLSRSGSLKSREESRKRNSRRLESEELDLLNGYEDEYGDHNRTIRGLESLTNSPRHSPRHSVSPEEEEDVFLKLARTSTVSDSAASKTEARTQRRRTRLSQFSHHRSSLPVEVIRGASVEDDLSTPARVPLPPSDVSSDVEMNSSPPDQDEDTWRASSYIQPSPLTDYPTRRMSNTVTQDAYAAPEERHSITPRASVARSGSLLRREHASRSPPPSSHSRSYSNTVDSPPRLRAGLTSKTLSRANPTSPPRANRRSGIIESESPRHTGRSVGGNSSAGPEDSVSTVSTTAASSVWDELDDLKSRIRRLELTGKMPSIGGGGHGNASNSSGDRPQTATTTVTTISSSPRHKDGPNDVSPPTSVFSTAAANSHPLLHTALANAKTRLAPEIHKHLQLAANDALALANSMSPPGTPGSQATDRQLRKHANGVIRSLTELAIALTENRATISTPSQTHFPHSDFSGPRSESRATTTSRPGSVFGGRESVFGDRARLTERAHLRLAERKNSLANISTGAGYSPRTSVPQANETATSSPGPAGLRSRQSMLLKSRPATVIDDDEYDRMRAPSRAGTELGPMHRSVRDFSSVERPSPSAARRHYATTSVSFPSPTLPSSATRRYFSSRPETADREAASEVGVRFEREAPVNGRLSTAIAGGDQDFAAARYRSESLGRTRRTALRPSVDLGSSSGRANTVRGTR